MTRKSASGTKMQHVDLKEYIYIFFFLVKGTFHSPFLEVSDEKCSDKL